jgi:hypothetical protein
LRKISYCRRRFLLPVNGGFEPDRAVETVKA